MRELQNILGHFAKATEAMALATIVGTRGSSYRRAGTRMLILGNGKTIGALSGGCIEDEVAERARSVMENGQARRFDIDTLKRFGCPGALDILLERIEPGNEFLSYLQTSFQQRQAAEIVVCLDAPAGSFPEHRRSHSAEGFRQILLPPVRVVVVGRGPDSIALGEIGSVLGWEMIFLEAAQIDASLADTRTALVIKNHHFGRDLAALSEGLAQPFGYVGLLSSMKRKNSLMQALDPEHFSGNDDGFTQLHGPAGLDLGSETPEEIALSIISEIQAAMTGHSGGFLKDSRDPIHQPIRRVALWK